MKQMTQLIDLHVVYVGSLVFGLCLVLYSSLFASIRIKAGPANPWAFYVCLSFFTHLSFLLPRIIIRAKDKSRIPGSTAPYVLANSFVSGLFGVICGLLIFIMLS